MKQGLLWSPCPHSISPKIQSFKQPIFQLTNKWRKEGEAMLINSVTQEKSKKKGIAIDFKVKFNFFGLWVLLISSFCLLGMLQNCFFLLLMILLLESNVVNS